MGTITESAKAFMPKLSEIRRDFHMHPEVSQHEERTGKKVAEYLKEMGCDEVYENVGGYGVVGVIKGKKPGKVVALRADMDALQIQEMNEVPYKSQNDGVMHACGHDNHMTGLLGAAMLLCERREEIAGTEKLIFQPAEEHVIGSKAMIAEGALDGVDAIFGQHVWGTLDIPYIDVTAGPRMAYSGRFTVDVIGTSSHAATPHLGADAITGAAAIINNLQQYVSRMSNPLDPVVLTIGTISGGNRYNAIANHVTMEGVTRAYFLDKHEEAMRRIVENTAKGLGMTAELKYAHVVNPVINDDDDLTEIAQNAVKKLFGEETLYHMPPMMGSEDFSWFGKDGTPYIYGFVASHNKDWDYMYGNHHEKYDVDETILHRGAAVAAQFAADYLAETAQQ